MVSAAIGGMVVRLPGNRTTAARRVTQVSARRGSAQSSAIRRVGELLYRRPGTRGSTVRANRSNGETAACQEETVCAHSLETINAAWRDRTGRTDRSKCGETAFCKWIAGHRRVVPRGTSNLRVSGSRVYAGVSSPTESDGMAQSVLRDVQECATGLRAACGGVRPTLAPPNSNRSFVTRLSAMSNVTDEEHAEQGAVQDMPQEMRAEREGAAYGFVDHAEEE